MANHPNRTKANRERYIARTYRFWLAEVEFFDRELTDTYRREFWPEIEQKRAVALARCIAFASTAR